MELKDITSLKPKKIKKLRRQLEKLNVTIRETIQMTAMLKGIINDEISVSLDNKDEEAQEDEKEIDYASVPITLTDEFLRARGIPLCQEERELKEFCDLFPKKSVPSSFIQVS